MVRLLSTPVPSIILPSAGWKVIVCILNAAIMSYIKVGHPRLNENTDNQNNDEYK